MCIGNTCRSPFAERYFNKRCRELDLPHVASSGGTLPYRYGIPYEAIEAARAFNVNLSDHVPKYVGDVVKVFKPDLVLTMERDLVDEVKCICEIHGIDVPVMTLIGYVTGMDDDIEDPFGCDLTTYLKVYSTIAHYIDKLLEVLSKKRDKVQF